MTAPLDPEMLLRAYSIGVFPMADSRDAHSVYWVEPKVRAILPLTGFHLSKSLRKVLQSNRFQTTADHAFGDIVALCAEAASDRPNTWINNQIEEAVALLHAAGRAHSIETWLDGELVGGLYGIAFGGAFFGESMVSRATDASKVALAHLVARLRVGGFQLLDCQFMTTHLASLGATEISQKNYLSQLQSALSVSADFLAFERLDDPPSPATETMTLSGPASGWRIVQSLTHTSKMGC
jgi:leucyl/phenylalanyl-tRNA---protein transferase